MRNLPYLGLVGVLMLGCAAGKGSPESQKSAYPPADVSKIKPDFVESHWSGPTGAPPVGRGATLRIRNLNPYPIFAVKVKGRIRYDNSPKTFEVESEVKDLVSTGNLYQGLLMPGHFSKLFSIDIPMSRDGWRNDSHTEADIVEARRLVGPKDAKQVDTVPKLIGWMIEQPLETVLKGFQENPKLLRLRTDRNATPLHLATLLGEPKALDALVSLGLDPEAQTKSGHNLYHYAALSTPAMIQKVRQLRVKPKLTNESQYSPLHYAVEFGNMAVIEPLVRAGCDPNAKEKSGMTPLLWALYWNHPNAAIELKRLGAKTAVFDEGGVGPIGKAIQFGSVEVLDVLYKNKIGSIHEEGPTGITPIILSVDIGAEEAFQWLIRHGAKFEKKNAKGVSAKDVLAKNNFEADRMKWGRVLQEVNIAPPW